MQSLEAAYRLEKIQRLRSNDAMSVFRRQADRARRFTPDSADACSRQKILGARESLAGPHRVQAIEGRPPQGVMVVVAAFSNGTTCKATILLQLPDFALKFRFILKAIVTG
jgi:hypothetical protein